MPVLHPYLNYDGTCREAFDHYRSVFGGEFDQIMTYGDMPPQPGMPPPAPEHANRLIHISLPIGGTTLLMGSDWPESFGPMQRGNANSIMLDVESRAEADRIFQGLGQNGRVSQPMADTFWGAYFGMLTDAWGVQWMISFNTQPKA